jgi:leader peptidase (prepilin peptidase)/N-methyltransferase
MITFSFFIFGLLIGSFCNVLIFRMRKSISIIKPASHCQKCQTPILWRDNIPIISFILLKGRCRKCQTKISWQYPIVEFLVGVSWASFGYLYSGQYIDSFIITILWAIIFTLLWIIFIYDWKYMEIPMTFIWLSLILILIINFLIDINNGLINLNFFQSTLFIHSLSGSVAFLFFFGLSYISNEEWMGYGDGFLALLVGLALGPWAGFLAVLIAFCVGAIYSIIIITLGKANLKSQVAFGPFLIFGFMAIFYLKIFFPGLLELL